jgi:carboxymethylenebutenolidase
MRRAGVVIALLFLATAVTVGDAVAEDRVVRLPSAQGEARGYLSLPIDEGRHSAVIVLHDRSGLGDWTKQQTQRLAAMGYVALAVDLYRGKTAGDEATATELMRSLPTHRVLSDLGAAFTFLASRPDVDPDRIGVIGWCMGGGLALTLAAFEPRVAAVVVNYGPLPADPATAERITAPLLANYSRGTRGTSVQAVEDFYGSMRAAGKDADVRIYEVDAHEFMNPRADDEFDPETSNDAWDRISRFFDEKLRAKIPNS